MPTIYSYSSASLGFLKRPEGVDEWEFINFLGL